MKWPKNYTKEVKVFGFYFFYDDANFKVPQWICFHDCYMYNGRTFWKCVGAVITGYKKDRNLVG